MGLHSSIRLLPDLTNFQCYLLLFGLLSACTPDQPAVRHRVAKHTAPASEAAAATTSAAPPDASAEYAWEFDACFYTARYDPRRYSKAQLDTTLLLVYQGVDIEDNDEYFAPATLAALRLDTLTARHKRRMRRYQNMRVVEQPVWLALKKQAIQEIEDDYQLKKLAIEALANPEVLLTADFPPGCKKYIYNVARPNDSLMLQDWRAWAEENKKESNDPGSYMSSFHYRYNSNERLQLAKVELLTRGWLRCAGKAKRAGYTPGRGAEFEKLFIKVKMWCDDV